MLACARSSTTAKLVCARYGGGYGRKAPLKAIDLADVGYTITSTPVNTLLNPIAEGVSVWQRLGRKYHIKQVCFKYRLEKVVTTATNGDIGRILIVYDRQSNGAAPAIADVVNGRISAGTATGVPSMDYQNRDNLDRFRILYDKVLVLPNDTLTGALVTGSGGDREKVMVHNVKINLKGAGLAVRCSDTPGTIAALAEGSLHLITLGNVATPGYRIVGTTRVLYSDDQY